MKKNIKYIGSLVTITCALYFGMMAMKESYPFMKANVQKEILQKEVKYDKTDEEFCNHYVDFDILKSINKDICGWVSIPETTIEYPILIGETDDQYLHKDIYGNDSKLGCIFSFSDTKDDLSDARIVLFGHNMKDNQMFGELKKYMEDDEFRKKHKNINIYTENKSIKMEVFSIFICEDSDHIFYDNTKIGSQEYESLINELYDRNMFEDLNTYVTNDMKNQQTYSLVTCSGYAGSSYRLVVSAIAKESITV